MSTKMTVTLSDEVVAGLKLMAATDGVSVTEKLRQCIAASYEIFTVRQAKKIQKRSRG